MKTIRKGKIRGIVAIAVTLVMLVSLLGIQASQVLADASFNITIDASQDYLYSNDTVMLEVHMESIILAEVYCPEVVVSASPVGDTGLPITLDKDSGALTDITFSGDDGDGVLEFQEDWMWRIYNVNVLFSTTFTAFGDGYTNVGCTTPIASDAAHTETDAVTVIAPDTTVTIISSLPVVAAGSTVNLTVTEYNGGNSPLTNPYVLVSPGGYNLNRSSVYYTGGDQASGTGYGVLGVGETWTWTITNRVVGADTTFTADGHGTDLAGKDVSYNNGFLTERATVVVDTYNANTAVNITTSKPRIYSDEGETIDLTVTEANTGLDSLINPSVVVSASPGMAGFPVTLVKASGTYVSGDTDNDGVLDRGEVWVWKILGVAPTVDTTFEAIGHGWADTGTGLRDITYPEFPGERRTVTVDTIDSDTSVYLDVAEEFEGDPSLVTWEPDEIVFPCKDQSGAPLEIPDTVCLLIEEANDGDDPLDNPYVQVFADEVLLYTLSKSSPYFYTDWSPHGDTNNNGILDPGEAWLWIICDVAIPDDEDTTFTAIGHGIDSLNNDVTWYSPDELADAAAEEPPVYLRHDDEELDEVTVDVYCPNSIVDVCVWPCVSTTCVHKGDTFDLRISEENTGTDPLYDVSINLEIYMRDGEVPHTRTLVVNDPFYIGGDLNEDGVLDPGEQWKWKITDILLPVDQDYEYWEPWAQAWGFGWTDDPYTGSSYYEEISQRNGYGSEYDETSICVVEPGTECCISASEDIVRPGTAIDLMVTEANTGDQPLTGVSVKVYNSLDLVTPLYTLVKGDAYWVGGDTDGDGVLDELEEWAWEIPGVVVYKDTSFIAIGDGIDPLGLHITYPEFQNERSRLDIDVINPDTDVDVCVLYPDSDPYIYSGDEIDITVYETNTGDDPITNPYVWLGALDLETGEVIDINPWGLANGYILDRYTYWNDVEPGVGDLNGNNKLDPGETWGWLIPNVVITNDGDVRIIAKGHGNDSLLEDVCYANGYRDERDWDDIDVIAPGTDADICTFPCDSTPCVYEDAPFTLRVDEINTGDCALTSVWVSVAVINGTATSPVFPLTLNCTSGSDPDITFSGDVDSDCVLDVGEMWTWILTDVVIGEETTFGVTGYGVDPLDNPVSVREDANEYDEITICTYDPDTYVYIYSSAPKVSVGDMIDLTISENNSGDCDLTDVNVKVYGNDVLLYTLDEDSDYYIGGDFDEDGILDDGESWAWNITQIVVMADTTYVAIGDGIDPLGGHVTWYSEAELDADATLINYQFERDEVVVEAIGPSTVVDIDIAKVIYADPTVDWGTTVETVVMTVTEANVGDESLTNPRVWVGGRNAETMAVVDINDDALYDGFMMGRYDMHFVSETDTDSDAELDPGETWTWVIDTYSDSQNLVIVDDVRLIAKGHGMDSLLNDITYYNSAQLELDPTLISYPDERDVVDVNVIAPDTEVCISTDLYVAAGGTTDVTVTEENIGDDPLSDVSVTVSPLGITLVKDDAYWTGGDTNSNGMLDPDDPTTQANEAELWTWIIPDITVDDTMTFEAIGDGIDSAGNSVTYPEYPDERDRLTTGTIGTEICMNICPCPIEEHDVYPGDKLTITISESNDGVVAINNAKVWIGGLDPVTMEVIDINVDDTGANGWAMGIGDVNYAGGDINTNGVLDPGETWVWVLTGVEVNEDVLIVVKGHGSVSGTPGDITYPDYPKERATQYVEVIED